jgi:hypothetical protein
MNSLLNEVSNEALVEAAKDVIKHVRIRTTLNSLGYFRLRASGDKDFVQDYDHHIVVSDDKKAVAAINSLRAALGEQDD